MKKFKTPVAMKVTQEQYERGTYYGKGNTIELKSKFTKEDLSQLLHGDFDDMLTKID